MKKKSPVRSLPIPSWPEADRAGWHHACRPRSRLKRGGAASHLAEVTRNDLARRHGYYLDFLERTSGLDQQAAAAAQVTPENVQAYLTELKGRVSSVTVHGSIYKLRRAAELIAQGPDFGWLAEIERDLELVMQPKSKLDRLVLSEVLLEAGLTLVTEAENSTRTDLARARGVRNGLMVALLAVHPMRLKNFASLELGRTIIDIKGSWWIVLPHKSTKSRRLDERRLPDMLKRYIDTYIGRYRPILMRSDGPTNAFWLASNHSGPMSYNGVERAVSDTTRSTIGVDVSPHLFRMSGASTAAVHGGHMPHLGSALLHHFDPRVTQESYNRATSVSATQAYASIIEAYRRGD
jgi:site-specific recombinase XerD